MMRIYSIALLLLLSVAMVGCATVGQPYAEHKVPEIKVGETTRAQIQQMFGNPWRTGSESGQQTWTYGHYRYSAFSDAQTSDLVVRFNEQNRVASYTFNRTTADPSKDSRGHAGP
ncbi:outer membrane protein assembly factor BamE [Marinospirillum sp.]|uniref:outer membrane protein assembly factor BamE domain-containing protein n=1 Tax=Marinospirillum sp. TaxID=2183934 RepID=UPI0025BD31FE|nr:outer membrane protein assembly factor BamE [Marinospirillum sp.]